MYNPDIDFERIKQKHLIGMGLHSDLGHLKGEFRTAEGKNFYIVRSEGAEYENEIQEMRLLYNPNFGGYVTIIAENSHSKSSIVLTVEVFGKDKRGIKRTTLSNRGKIFYEIQKDDGGVDLKFGKMNRLTANGAIDAYIDSHSHLFPVENA